MSETYTAVLDRIVDGETAVLLLEADGRVVDERILDVESLPEDGRHEGAVFEVELADEEELGAESGTEAEPEEQTETEEETETEEQVGTGGDLLDATYRPSEEADRRRRMADRFDRLSERLSDE